MPRKPNPELKKLALQLFGQGYSGAQILDKIEEEARKSLHSKLQSKYSGEELEQKVEEALKKWHLPTCVDTLYDWKKETHKQVHEAKTEFIKKVEDSAQASPETPGIISKSLPQGPQQKPQAAKEEKATPVQAPEAVVMVSSEAMQEKKPEEIPFPEEPSLSDFTARHVPHKTALQLLAAWDAAKQNGDSFYMNVVIKIAALYNEFPKIPLAYAKSLAELEAQGEEFHVTDAQELAKLAKRYRAWESNDNTKSFMDVAKYLGLWTELDDKERRALEAKLLFRNK